MCDLTIITGQICVVCAESMQNLCRVHAESVQFMRSPCKSMWNPCKSVWNPCSPCGVCANPCGVHVVRAEHMGECKVLSEVLPSKSIIQHTPMSMSSDSVPPCRKHTATEHTLNNADPLLLKKRARQAGKTKAGVIVPTGKSGMIKSDTQANTAQISAPSVS